MKTFFGTRNNTTSKKTNSPSKIFWLANGFLNRQLDFRSKNLSIWWFEGNFRLFRPEWQGIHGHLLFRAVRTVGHFGPVWSVSSLRTDFHKEFPDLSHSILFVYVPGASIPVYISLYLKRLSTVRPFKTVWSTLWHLRRLTWKYTLS